jgi:hypothetical protein
MSTPIKFQVAAVELLGELESSCLEVVLVPERRRTCEGGMIRVAVSKNATWYQRFCRQYASSRRRRKAAFDTMIKRAHTVRALERFAAGASPRGLRRGGGTLSGYFLSFNNGRQFWSCLRHYENGS